jgi:BMFP domain-containing protein YqiC
MTTVDLIKQFLPMTLRDQAQLFTIGDQFLQTMPDLIILILNSKSMDTKEEKQSWFNLLPLMNQEQVAKLRDILTREKQKLEEIEKKYEDKKDDIKAKYIQQWAQI